MKIALASLTALVVAACASTGIDTAPKTTATLSPTRGNSDVRGTVDFWQRGDRVHVSVNLTGFKPSTTHAFHVHEKGDCSSDDAMSAGGHFNPVGKPHGPQNAEHHAGDMPNLVADTFGNVHADFDLDGVTVASFQGKGLIVHRDADDYKSQPAGNAGPRMLCGVIGQP